jgi:hypothetical protein
MPPAKPLPPRKKNGQFTASAQAGQPPSSLATPPVPRPLSHNPSSRTASPSRPVSPAFRNASPSRTDLANLLDPHSDLDSGPTFVASHSRSASPTIPAPNRSRSPSPTTSDFPTSLESSQLDDARHRTVTSSFVVPPGYIIQNLPTGPVLVARPILSRPQTPPTPSPPPSPAFQYLQNPHFSLPPPTTNMSSAKHTGPAAMPSARSSRSSRPLYFSADKDQLISEFLHDYEEFADSCRLTRDQKFETILRYIPRGLKRLWKALPAYNAGDWDNFKIALIDLYPDVTSLSRDTRQGLETFRKLSAKSHIRDETDVLKYYRNFLTVATPLLEHQRITIEEYNTAFFKGFPHKVRNIIAQRFRQVHPLHPARDPFPLQGVLEAARYHFSSDQFHPQPVHSKKKSRDKHRSHAKHDYDGPDDFIQRTYGSTGTRSHKKKRRSRSNSDSESDSGSDSNSDSASDSGSDSASDSEESSDPGPQGYKSPQEYKSKHVHSKQSHASKKPSKSRGKDKEEPEDSESRSLVTKLLSLSIHDPSYLIAYSQCQRHFPELAQNLQKPQPQPTTSASVSVAYQAPPTAVQPAQPQPCLHLPPPVPAPAPAPITGVFTTQAAAPPDSKANFFSDKFNTRAPGCAFCGHLRHRIHGCPAAEEYVDTGRVRIVNRRLYLPTGQPIPNDGRGLGLKAGVDSWLAANPQYSATATASTTATVSTTDTASTTQHDPPPHMATLSFEIFSEPAADTEVPTGAFITEVDDEPDTAEKDTYPNELYNMFEVFATRNTDPAPPSAPATKAPPAPTASASASTTFVPNTRPPQYRYQASAEDQSLTKEVIDWVLEGKLDQMTPAHVFATSPPVRKVISELLRPRRVETGSFEQVEEDVSDPVAVLGLAAKREAEFSLPLREIDILVNNHHTEAGVLDQGSQIIVMREDLAKEIGAKINTKRTLCMEGANSSTSRTLGCAEDLDMRIGDVSFTVHAHVVRTAPFRLLLGRPFHNLLLCRLEDHPDRVDVSIRDPANPARSIAVPSRARQGTQVGYVSALTCQVLPELPGMETPKRYVATPSSLPLTDSPLSDHKAEDAVVNLVQAKANTTEHPVAASLPEESQIVQRGPEDPLLIPLPPTTHPPPCTPAILLTHECYDAFDHNRIDCLLPEKEEPAAHVLKAKEKALVLTEDIKHTHSTGIAEVFQATEGDITLATFLVPNLADKPFTADHIATRARQLQRREDNLAAIHSNILKSCFESVRQFERQFENVIRDCNFGLGAFVRVRNSSVEADLRRKAKPRSIGPMVVLCRTQNVPYHARSRSSIPVTRLVDRVDLARVIADEGVTRADDDDDDV